MHDVDASDRAILVSLESGDDARDRASLEELRELAFTAGALVVGEFGQKRRAPHVACYLGQGKAEELFAEVRELDANLVIFNGDLTSTQLRNLDEAVGARLVDRTQLILDIFAQRAHTREGQLQVELAQLTYLLPRITSLYTQFERQQGGIGIRG
ncbi:MAG: GTPase HflX, partial [Armatimonadetes bacterium]|nr:GTPase HflX [Armatimonadota bacterium]